MSPRGIPAPAGELPELPTVPLGASRLWRIHAAAAEPWFFDPGPNGRFNLGDVGTCYLAEERLGAFVEKFGRLLRPGGVIPEPLVKGQRLSSLRPPRVEVVDLTDPRVLGRAGLTAEIHSTTDYALTRSWALALRDAGYRGIRYRARHDPRGELTSVALFGSARPPRSAARTTEIPLDLIHEAAETFAITVLPRRHRRRSG
ncbi:MAG TPA: RES family NAD+ phosphorylase [Solirubrobacterales bacterium]